MNSFAIKLDIDVKRLQKGMELIDKNIKNLDSKFNGIDSSIKRGSESINTSLKKIVTVAGGLAMLKAAFNSFITTGADIGFFSMSIGESVEDIQAWTEAVKRMGGTAESIKSSIVTLKDNLYQMVRIGNPEMAKALGQLGIDFADKNGNLKKSTDLMLDIAGAFENISHEEARFQGKNLGLNEDTIRLLKLGRKELQGFLEVQKKNAVLTKEDVKASLEFKKAILDLQQAFKRVAAVGMRFMTPLLLSITKGLNTFVNFISKHRHFVISFFVSIATLITAIMLPALAKLAIAQIAAFGPLLAIAAVIALLYDDYKSWSEGGKSFFGDDWKEFEKFLKDVKADAAEIKKELQPLLDMMKEFGGEIKDLSIKMFVEQLKSARNLIKDVLDYVKNIVLMTKAIKDGDWKAAKNYALGSATALKNAGGSFVGATPVGAAAKMFGETSVELLDEYAFGGFLGDKLLGATEAIDGAVDDIISKVNTAKNLYTDIKGNAIGNVQRFFGGDTSNSNATVNIHTTVYPQAGLNENQLAGFINKGTEQTMKNAIPYKFDRGTR